MTARTKIAMHPHIIFIEFVMHPWYGPGAGIVVFPYVEFGDSR